MGNLLDGLFTQAGKIAVKIAGVVQPQRKYVNFGTGVVASDNPGTDSTDLTVTATGGGGVKVASLTALRALSPGTVADGGVYYVGSDPVPWINDDASGANFADDAVVVGGFIVGTVVKLTGVSPGSNKRFYRAQSAPVLPNVTALRLAVSGQHASIILQATSALGDGGGGVYIYDPADTTTSDDGAQVIVAGTRRYKAVDFYRVDVRRHGAKCDWVALAGLTMGAGSRVVTTASAAASWVGKWMTVTDAGALDLDGFKRPLQGIVASVVPGVSATLSSGNDPRYGTTFPASTSAVTSVAGSVFTDDSTAFKASLAFLSAFGGGEVFVPPSASGRYGLARCVKVPSNVVIRGTGAGSHVQMIDGGWNMNVDPDTQSVSDGQAFGMFNFYNVNNSRLVDLLTEGSIDTPTDPLSLLSPFGAYFASCSDCRTSGNTFRNYHYAAIFGSRTSQDFSAASMQRFQSLDDHFENCAYPTAKDLSIVMGNTVEFAGHDHVFARGTYKHCASPLNAAGDHCLQIDNTGQDCIGQIITGGDSFTVEGAGIRGNHFRTRLTHRNKAPTAVVPALTGFAIQPPDGPGRPAAVAGNMMHFEIAYRTGSFKADPSRDNILSEDHGLLSGDTIYVTSQGGTVAGGLAAATKYFVVNPSADGNIFQVSATLGGSAINITTGGTGYQTWHSGLFTANAGTDVITTNEPHGLVNGETIALINVGGALPAGLVRGTKYFIINATTFTFKVSLTSGGAAVDITGTGTGLHSFMDQGLLANRPLVGTTCDAANTKLTSNVVTIGVLSDIVSPNQLNGHQTLGLIPQATSAVDNTYEMFTPNGSTYTGSGIVGIACGPVNVGTWPIYLAHNRVLGWGPGAGCAAYNINANHAGGQEVSLRVEGDVYDLGIAVLGNSVSFANHPIYLGWDSALGGSGVTSPFALGVLANEADTSADVLLFRKSGTGELVAGSIRNAAVSGAAAIDGSKIVPSFGAQALDASTGLFTGLLTIADGLFAVPGAAGVAKWSIHDWAGVSTAYTAFYVGGVTPGTGNYALAGNGSSQLNVNSGSSLTGELTLRVGGDKVLGVKRGSGGIFSDIYTYAGTPEAALDAGVNSIAIDCTNHDIYIKTTAIGTLTGWKQITRAA